MYTITVTVDDLVQEGVELLHDKFLQDFAEMNHTGFTIEISEQSVEEAMEEEPDGIGCVGSMLGLAGFWVGVSTWNGTLMLLGLFFMVLFFNLAGGNCEE